jgi:MFS superfamily sulfate permease-like transporter
MENIKKDDLERLFKDKIYKDEVITAPKLRYLIYKFAMLRRQLRTIEYIKHYNIKKAIIVYPFNINHRIKFIRHFKERVSDKVAIYDNNSIQQFNTGEIDYLIVHPANIAYGVNLQHSQAKDIIYLSPFNIGVEQFTQLNKRLARQGNNNKIINIHLTYSLDIEKLNYKKLLKKQFNLNEFLKYFSNLSKLS